MHVINEWTVFGDLKIKTKEKKTYYVQYLYSVYVNIHSIV